MMGQRNKSSVIFGIFALLLLFCIAGCGQSSISQTETLDLSDNSASEKVQIEIDSTHKKLDAEIELSNATTISGKSAIVFLHTNLPKDTKVFLELKDFEGKYKEYAVGFANSEGKISVVNGLQNEDGFSGLYRLTVQTAKATEQNSTVQEIIGGYGQYLTGDHIVTDSEGNQYVRATFDIETFGGKKTDDAASSGENAEVPSSEPENPPEYQRSPTLDMEWTIRSRINEYSGTDIDSITLNEDLGTETEGDYIALVYLTWNVQNSGKLSKKVLKMYSDDLAATVAKDAPNIQEIAIFWTVPYLNASAKCAYERRGEGMYEMDMMWDSAFN